MAVLSNEVMRATKRPRVLLADDHQMVADALRRVLEPRCEVVGTVNNGHALLRAAATLQPEVIVLDIAMPEMNGLDAARHLKRSVPKAKLVFLTMNEDPELVREAFRSGASAFLLKQSGASELTEAVERVLKGGSYVTPRAAKGQDNVFLRGPQAREKAAEPTLRQREVIQLLAEGRSMMTNAELVQYAVKHNIISI